MTFDSLVSLKSEMVFLRSGVQITRENLLQIDQKEKYPALNQKGKMEKNCTQLVSFCLGLQHANRHRIQVKFKTLYDTRTRAIQYHLSQ